MLKKILVGVLGLIVLVAVGIFLVGSNIDSIVKAAIEKYGTEAAQAETTLKKVSLSATNGEGSLEGFVLGNPEGFATKEAIRVDKIAVKLDTKSIMGKGPIVVLDVLIDAPQVTYEMAGKGESNLQKIQDNVSSYANKLTRDAENTAGKPKEETKEESRKIVIKNLVIRNGQVKLSHELLKGDNLVTAKIPFIQLVNIGEGRGGATPADIANAVLDRLTSAAISVGHANLVKQLRQQGLDSLKGAVQESETGKTVGKAIEGLFGK